MLNMKVGGQQTCVNKGTAGCAITVTLSKAKSLRWLKMQILRSAQDDKKQKRCNFAQSDGSIVN